MARYLQPAAVYARPDCPPLESGVEAEYACTSVVTGDTVDWVVRNKVIQGADGLSIDSTEWQPTFRSPTAHVEWALTHNLNQAYGLDPVTVSCPDVSPSSSGEIQCAANAGGDDFPMFYQGGIGTEFQWASSDVMIDKKTERKIMNDILAQHGFRMQVDCQMLPIQRAVADEEFTCSLAEPSRGIQGSARVTVTSGVGDYTYEWNAQAQ